MMAFLCDSEAVVLHVELYRYALLGDEKVGCRHFPLLFQEHLSGGKSQHFEAFVRDSVNPEHKHYFSLEISCDQLCSSSTYSQSQFSSFSFSSLSPSSRTSPPPSTLRLPRRCLHYRTHPSSRSHPATRQITTR